MKTKRLFIFSAIFLTGFSILVAINSLSSKNYRFKGSEINPPADTYDITLVNAAGKEFRLSEQTGKVVLIFFGFTHCTDICPTTLARYREIYDRLGDQSESVRFVYITVDPERDTPEIMDGYTKGFNPDFIGLSGTEVDLLPIYQYYGVFREKQEILSASDYEMNHTSVTFVIDKQGKWRLTFPYELGVDEMLSDVIQLVNE